MHRVSKVDQENLIGAENRRRIVLELRDKFVQMSRLSLDEFNEVCLSEVKQIVSYAKIRIPWYTNTFAHVKNIESSSSVSEILEQLPILTRELVQAHFDGLYFKSPQHDEIDYVVQATSGSTSKPVSVMKFGPLYSAEYDAITLTEWHLHNRDSTKLVSSFRLIDKDARNVPLGPPLSYIGANRRSTALSVLEHSIEELLNELHELHPDYLYAGGVVMRALAVAQLQGVYPQIALEQILVVSDRVDPQLRALVKEAFSARIIDRYSSEEFGYIALQCPTHDHLHACSPSVHIEIVDEGGKPCPIGVPGRVLVTSLHNFAMPLIRYEIGDVAQFGSPCDTGLKWPVIERIVGRTRDGVTLPNGDFHLVTFFNSKMLMLRKIRDFQIVLFNNAILFLNTVASPLTPDEKLAIETELLSAFRIDYPVVFRESSVDHWRSMWKRNEWDRIDHFYSDDINDSELYLLLEPLNSK